MLSGCNYVYPFGDPGILSPGRYRLETETVRRSIPSLSGWWRGLLAGIAVAAKRVNLP